MAGMILPLHWALTVNLRSDTTITTATTTSINTLSAMIHFMYNLHKANTVQVITFVEELLQETLRRYSTVDDTTERLLSTADDAPLRTKGWVYSLQPLWRYCKQRHTGAFSEPGVGTSVLFAQRAQLDEHYGCRVIASLCRWAAHLCTGVTEETAKVTVTDVFADVSEAELSTATATAAAAAAGTTAAATATASGATAGGATSAGTGKLQPTAIEPAEAADAERSAPSF
eukprot:5160-Heterococcus_DN1.PRE.2